MRFEELIIYVLCVAVGALRVVPQLVEGGHWGAEPTIAAVMLGLGVLGLVSLLVRGIRRPS